MITFSITVWSKNKTSLNHFVLFFKKYLIHNSNTIAKYFQKKVNTKIITVLKSPHVNKKSQEQFETKIFKKQINIKLRNNWKLISFFRRVCHSMCSDINIKVKQLFHSKHFYKKKLHTITLKNFKIKMHNNSTVKVKNFKFQNNLKFLKKDTTLNLIMSKKTNQLFSIFQFYN